MEVKTASKEAIVLLLSVGFAVAGKETTCKRRPRSQEWMQWKQWKEARKLKLTCAKPINRFHASRLPKICRLTMSATVRYSSRYGVGVTIGVLWGSFLMT
jgi:ribulose bisphosphate carboxylase small subunit